MLENLFNEEILPIIQAKTPMVLLKAFSFGPITCYQEEETDPTTLKLPFS